MILKVWRIRRLIGVVQIPNTLQLWRIGVVMLFRLATIFSKEFSAASIYLIIYSCVYLIIYSCVWGSYQSIFLEEAETAEAVVAAAAAAFAAVAAVVVAVVAD